MANEEHLAILRQGVQAWNRWREENPHIRADLSEWVAVEKDLCHIDLRYADLRAVKFAGTRLNNAKMDSAELLNANLSGASLVAAHLSQADLRLAKLTKALLNGADLCGADLTDVDLSNANLQAAFLYGTVFRRSILRGSNFEGAELVGTIFADLTLSAIEGLGVTHHRGPSSIDLPTLMRSRNLPVEFLRGCGLHKEWTERIASMNQMATEFYSCFISYSSQDDKFVHRLHADLHGRSVLCWYAPEDMKIGDRTRRTIDKAIRQRDKVVVVLSENSIDRDWVEHEVRQALEEETRRGEDILLPIRLDDAVFDAEFGWAKAMREAHKETGRHIGDFCKWEDHGFYQKAFERLLRDLEKDKGASPQRRFEGRPRSGDNDCEEE